MQRLDVVELADLFLVAPTEELVDGRHVGRTGVPVADCGGENSRNWRATCSLTSATIAGATIAEGVALKISRGLLTDRWRVGSGRRCRCQSLNIDVATN
jgi:hypothetical protein